MITDTFLPPTISFEMGYWGVIVMTEFLSTGLNEVLVREVAAGNHIVERGMWGDVRMVFLSGPFRATLPDASYGLEFREVNDPHYWLEEVVDPVTREVVACRF